MAVAAVLVIAGVSPAQAAFPGPNGQIAYQVDVTSGGGILYEDIYVADPNGANPVNLTHNEQKAVFDTDPAWSADGKWIAFSHWTSTGRSIWVMACNGTTAHPVTHPPGSASDITPAWAPDGSKIAFARINSSGFDVWTVRDDGSEPTNLATTPAAYNFEPNWSPDGARIACGSNSHAIMSMKADGTDRRRLYSRSGFTADDPNWSPDGTSIAFDTGNQLDGSYPHVLITPPAEAHRPPCHRSTRPAAISSLRGRRRATGSRSPTTPPATARSSACQPAAALPSGWSTRPTAATPVRRIGHRPGFLDRGRRWPRRASRGRREPTTLKVTGAR